MKAFTLVTLCLLTRCATTLESLANSEACRQDYEAIKDTCLVPAINRGKSDDFWSELACLQSPPENTRISQGCDSLLWEVKLNMTSQEGFLTKASQMCTDEINELRMCETDRISPAHFVSCLVQNKHVTKNTGCRVFLDRIESLIFSDFRLVGNFTNACKNDVLKFECGRTGGNQQSQPHSQGKTIACLEEKIQDLESKCKKEIFQLAELQGEKVDYDKVLFDSCQEEINRFCSGLTGGQHGRIYDCLMSNKLSPGMSQQCSQHITRRQILTSLDYKVSVSLAAKCDVDIKKHKCSEPSDSKDEVVKLSHIIVCLEDAMFNGAQINGECVASIDDHRHQLLQDLSISPEIVKYCQPDLNTHCQNNQHKLHCLMNVTLRQDIRLAENCQKALEDFLRETQEGMDWKADPALEDACAEVVFSVCDPKNAKGRVMDCLMENLSSESEAMTGECRKVLMQIHYFMAREVIIDKKLYQECRKDATQLCGAEKNWHKSSVNPQMKLVFPCLVRNMYHVDDDDDDDNDDRDEEDYVLSKGCEHQVERVLKQRAHSVMLKPELERACRDFLHMHCASHVQPGEELKCLQENYEVLPVECKGEVSRDAQVQMNSYYLHPNWIKGCETELSTHCAGFHDRKDARGAVQCLFRAAIDYPFGSPNGINKKCAAVLEGIQVLEMKDFKFSPDLRKACKPSVKRFCKNEPTTTGVVSCLVHIIIDDIVNDNDAKISKDCITQLDIELQIKHSNLKLDPVLASACQEELSGTCAAFEGLEAVECLKGIKHSDLSQKCQKVLLQEEEEEAINNQVDVVLMRNCKKEIQQHCSNANTSSIIKCLAEFVQELDFDQKCRKIVVKRITQQSFDFRLNTDLTRACRLDIKKYCSNVIQKEDGFNEGKVIFCLKEIYTQNVNLLAKGCGRQLMLEVKQESLARVDPRLESLCPKLIGKCKTILASRDKREGLEFCLYHHLQIGDVPDGKECSLVLSVHAESQNRDVQADHDLFRACSLDLNKFCRDVIPGDGKKFACLVAVTKEKNFALEPKCEQIVENRIEMYKVALKIHPMKEPWEVYKTVMESDERNQIMSVVFFFLAIIFCIGLCFGRVTKRVNRDVKNK